jgi:hypothetical protein
MVLVLSWYQLGAGNGENLDCSCQPIEQIARCRPWSLPKQQEGKTGEIECKESTHFQLI